MGMAEADCASNSSPAELPNPAISTAIKVFLSIDIPFVEPHRPLHDIACDLFLILFGNRACVTRCFYRFTQAAHSPIANRGALRHAFSHECEIRLPTMRAGT